MQLNRKLAQTSPRLQQADRCADNLPEVPREAACFRKVEESHKRKNMPNLHKYIYIRASKAKNMQQSMCAQIVMGKSWWAEEPNISRVVTNQNSVNDQLKAIGNGQVTLCAATAFRELIVRFA